MSSDYQQNDPWEANCLDMGLEIKWRIRLGVFRRSNLMYFFLFFFFFTCNRIKI